MEDFEKLPKMAEWDTSELTVPADQHLSIGTIKPNYNLTFHNSGREIGRMDFNGPEMVFEGNAAESAKVFIDWIATAFKGRLDEEYKRGYEDAKQGKELQR